MKFFSRNYHTIKMFFLVIFSQKFLKLKQTFLFIYFFLYKNMYFLLKKSGFQKKFSIKNKKVILW